jgi:hypothetical protein
VIYCSATLSVLGWLGMVTDDFIVSTGFGLNPTTAHYFIVLRIDCHQERFRI